MSSKMRRTESREVWPYRFCEGALDSCALILNSGDKFDAGTTIFTLKVDEQAHGSPLDFKLKLELDSKRLEKETGLLAKDVTIVLIVRNDEAKHHWIMAHWPSESVPAYYESRLDASQFGPNRLELVLAAVLKSNRERDFVRAWRLGSVLAEKRFKVVRPSTPGLFEIHFTDFEAKGWPVRALWHVDFKDLEGSTELPATDVVAVHLNSRLPVLHAIFDPTLRSSSLRGAASLLRPLITAEILSDVCLPILHHLSERKNDTSEILDEMAEDSIAHKVLTALRENANLEAHSALDLLERDPGSLRGKIQDMVEVGRFYDLHSLNRLQEK